MAPTRAHGKICYIQIPAEDVRRSAEFYVECFGWQTRTRPDGALAFDDGVGEISGEWVIGRLPAATGLMVYVMVDDLEAACETVIANGGAIEAPVGVDAGEMTAHIRDPFGNVLGIYQEPGEPSR